MLCAMMLTDPRGACSRYSSSISSGTETSPSDPDAGEFWSCTSGTVPAQDVVHTSESYRGSSRYGRAGAMQRNLIMKHFCCL